jgi:hypothetical protein
MPTNFGGRQRPHFLVGRFIAMDGSVGEDLVPALPSPNPAESESAKPVMTEQNDQFAGQTVDPPSLKEELQDEVPW